MTAWPPIGNDKTLARLAMDEDEFAALSARLAARIGGRHATDEDYERAIAYPWAWPRSSFLLRDGRARELGESPPGKLLERALTARAAGGEPLHPLITFGSNGSPDTLIKKLASLPADQREVLVICGQLAGHDVAFSPHLAVYGSLPATVVKSPGTRVRAAVLWVTVEQLEALTWTEFNYLLARLPGRDFAPDSGLPVPPEIFLYVSRHGALQLNGSVQAMAAIPATGRELPELDQAAALDMAAAIVLGDGEHGRRLVTRTIEDYRWATGDASAALRGRRESLDRSLWELMTPPRG